MIVTRRTALLSGVSALLVTPALAAQPEVYTESGIAIDGTDAVAYFNQSRPVPGSAEHALDWNGSKWLFSSAENKARFEADPAAYAPQYGGYCAFAMSKGYVAPTVPEAWSIVDGKLYLNFSLGIRKRWSTNIPGNIANADEFWPDPLQN